MPDPVSLFWRFKNTLNVGWLWIWYVPCLIIGDPTNMVRIYPFDLNSGFSFPGTATPWLWHILSARLRHGTWVYGCLTAGLWNLKARLRQWTGVHGCWLCWTAGLWNLIRLTTWHSLVNLLAVIILVLVYRRLTWTNSLHFWWTHLLNNIYERAQWLRLLRCWWIFRTSCIILFCHVADSTYENKTNSITDVIF